MYHILIVEDDVKLQTLLKEFLEKYNYRISVIHDFKQIETEFKALLPDLVLLDVNLPYYDGFYYCRLFRRVSKVPIIFVSARDGDMEQVMGMEIGGDDYVVKPLNFDVLLAKVKSHLRRNYGELAQKGESIHINGLSLDETLFKMTHDNQSVELSKNEFKLLKKLIECHNQYVMRADLLEALWDDQVFVDENTLTVNVSRVKQRLKEIGITNAIQTKRGVGYKICIEKGELDAQ